MSKLEDRAPTLATREQRLAMTTNVLEDVLRDGRIDKSQLVAAVQQRINEIPVNTTLIETEGRKHIADQLVSGWANLATIKFDRTQRVPVYQVQLGFAGSFFKVGSEYVSPEAMTMADFDVMIERMDRRIENAQTDRAIVVDFYDRARPGLEAGQNLLQQFEAGTLELQAANEQPDELEGGVPK